MKLSKKKEDQLFNCIHEDIFNARLKINLLLRNYKIVEEVDMVLYDLSNKVPQKAVELFNSNQP